MVFEKVEHTQLQQNKSILHKQQYGFRAKKSTTQAIFHFLQYLCKHLGSGNIVFYLFLDFCKAVDCVNHKILLSKLNTCGVRGIALHWFRSYLTNREQYVSINNVDSNPRVIQCGVLQGSILGPLLFLILINDITKCSNQFKCILYADNSTLSTYVPGDNVLDSAELINRELKCLERWLKSNKISINADKTKYMLFSYYKNVTFPDISVGNNTINETFVTKFWGIHIDKQLNFVNNITEMSMKVAKSIGLLYKLNRFLHETILKTLYTSHIHPYLSYRGLAWNKSKYYL